MASTTNTRLPSALSDKAVVLYISNQLRLTPRASRPQLAGHPDDKAGMITLLNNFFKVNFFPAAPIQVSVLFLLFFSCSRTEPEIGFYYWKSSFDLTETEQRALDTLEVKHLYIKFFDVDTEGGAAAMPKAPIRFAHGVPEGYRIVPCIFITNRTFQGKQDPGALAEQIWDYLQQINTRYGLQPDEYQFDCDWSPSTRQAYFAFLERINRLNSGASISVTIRLHQYRYPDQTGVPPADKGTLMYYNMGDIEDVQESNSLLNNEKGFAYLAESAYPLPLDVALPIFSWALAYRLGDLAMIINLADQKMLDNEPHLEKISNAVYQVKENFYFEGHYLNEGDLLRFEFPDTQRLEEAAGRLQKIKSKSGNILFFHLDEPFLQNYPPGFIRSLAGRF